MKIAMLCSILLATTMPNMARAEPMKAQGEQANCRIVSMKILRTVDGETTIEYIIRCDAGPNGQPI
jgi:hypothetical protein